ncbi:MAG: type I DNA topoisomerase [Candidatus Hydrothermales bacterium]
MKGKKVLIVESPSKAKTIEKYLKGEFKVLASYGHIKDLPEDDFGVNIEKGFEPKFVIIEEKKKIIEKLKKETENAERILLGCDPDREGEAICFHIKEEVKRDDAKRVLFYEITEDEIRKAIENPTEINLNKVESQFSRRILDRIVGYKVSPILWKLIKRGLSAGRVQTVALRIIVEREMEIQNFIPQKYFTVSVIFIKDGKEFKGEVKKYKGQDVTKIEDKTLAEEIKEKIFNSLIKVLEIKTKIREKTPPEPFKTSTLQESASKILSFSPGKTMRIAQMLFEGLETPEGRMGLITYHRTDSVRISEKVIPEIKSKIKELFGEEYVRSKERKFKESKRIQGAHECIRPTKISLIPEDLKDYLKEDELKLYEMIYFRTLSAFSENAKIEDKKVIFSTEDIEGEIQGKKLIFDGFMRILGKELEEIEIPDILEGEILKLKDVEIVEKQTQPPPRYTEADLVKTLEKLGIGRPSTYAPIIEILYQRNYVEKIGKLLFPTELGKKVCDILVAEFPEIFNVEFTKKMEDFLDEIEEGNLERNKFLEIFWDEFSKIINKIEGDFLTLKKTYLQEETEEICPKCGSKIFIKWGKYGKFMSCSNFPKCDYKKDLVQEEFLCPKCKEGYLVKRKGKKFFYGCSRYPDCDFASPHKPEERICPHCSFSYSFKITKKRKPFYRCPSCGKSFK